MFPGLQPSEREREGEEMFKRNRVHNAVVRSIWRTMEDRIVFLRMDRNSLHTTRVGGGRPRLSTYVST